MKTGSELTTRVTSLAYGGDGIVRHNGITGFIRWVLPDELVKSRVIEVKKNYFRSQLLEVLEPSPFRVTPKGLSIGVHIQLTPYLATDKHR